MAENLLDREPRALGHGDHVLPLTVLVFPHLQQHAQMRRHFTLGRNLPGANRHEEVLGLGQLARTQLFSHASLASTS